VTFTFTLTKRAHWRAVRDVTARTLSHKINIAFLLALPLVVIAIGLTRREEFGWFLLDYLGLLLLGPFVLFVGFPLVYYMNVASFHRNNAVVQRPQTFEFTPERLVMRGPLHNADVSWDAINRIIETRHTFLFYISKNAAHFLPKDSLSPDEIRSLRENLVKWMPDRVRVRGDTP